MWPARWQELKLYANDNLKKIWIENTDLVDVKQTNKPKNVLGPRSELCLHSPHWVCREFLIWQRAWLLVLLPNPVSVHICSTWPFKHCWFEQSRLRRHTVSIDAASMAGLALALTFWAGASPAASTRLCCWTSVQHWDLWSASWRTSCFALTSESMLLQTRCLFALQSNASV